MAVNPMIACVKGGLVYFAVVFCVAFCLGVVRVALIIPLIGELIGVLLELPIILFVSWKTSRWTTQLFMVRPYSIDAMVMGLVAFTMLMLAEFALSAVAFDRDITIVEFAKSLVSSAPHMLGLAGQGLFALFPFLIPTGVVRGKKGRGSKM